MNTQSQLLNSLRSLNKWFFVEFRQKKKRISFRLFIFWKRNDQDFEYEMIKSWQIVVHTYLDVISKLTEFALYIPRWRTGNCWQKSDNIPSLSRNNSTPYSHIWKNFCNVFKRILNFICLWWNNCEISSASPHNVVKSPFLVRISNAYKIVLSFQFFLKKSKNTL